MTSGNDTQASAGTDVEGLAAWATAADYSKLSKRSTDEAPTHILDALGCCVAALKAKPVQAMRAVITEETPGGTAPLLGGAMPD